jgi:hypothetical protein
MIADKPPKKLQPAHRSPARTVAIGIVYTSISAAQAAEPFIREKVVLDAL